MEIISTNKIEQKEEPLKKLIICRGIQGSGKSTFAKQWCHEDPEHRVRFNNDDIRNMLGDYWIPSREEIVVELKKKFLLSSMERGYDIIIDNMNLNPKEVQFYENLIRDWNNLKNIPTNHTKVNYEIEFKNFFTPVEECIRRDSMRPNPIGEKVIKDTWKRYKGFIIQEEIKNMLEKTPAHVEGGQLAILVDMDATLCLNTTNRPYYGKGAAEGMLNDIAIEEICTLVRCMKEKCKVFIVTGREGTQEIIDSTKKWLSDHNITVDGMFFRPIGDYSPSAKCKRIIYEKNIKGKFNVLFILEDNNKCVEMWRDLGLVCLQPNEGKF